jgi:threonine synthase
MKCGLPVSKLAVASNRNDILTRFFSSGRMKTEQVQSTLSPSMDIQISSNFERLLFDLCMSDGVQVNLYMRQLQAQGEFNVTPVQLGMARQVFTAAKVDDELKPSPIFIRKVALSWTRIPPSASRHHVCWRGNCRSR